MKIGRNQPCPCGSGRKYKRCHGDRSNNATSRPLAFSASVASHFLERHKADELIRQQQQGLGRPIVAIKFKDQQLVAAGNTLYYSPKWKTFTDFLVAYLGSVLGKEWGNAEIAKPLAERHPILQWYNELCHFQRKHSLKPGEINSAPMTGVCCCYYGLAYGLYLLKHNVQLQKRLVKRLKDPKQFQGVYYEVIIANSLIRAGFELTLEDETDETSKHCEFAAVSKKTGKKFWVEAKMRAVEGVLGKTKLDGTNSSDPTCKLSEHVSEALKKPASDQRLIFADINADSQTGATKPAWVDKATKRLDAREKDLKPGQNAYVFVTNMSFHRALQTQKGNAGCAIMGYGLGIPDFCKPGYYRVSEIYRSKQKHIDAYDIAESLQKYPQLPETFDGSLPSSLNGKSSKRVIIGETYIFKGKDGEDIVATVTTASVDEKEKVEYIGTSTGHIFTQPMSDDAFEDYRRHPEAYWGKIQPVPKKAENLYDLFEFFLKGFQETPKARLLELMKGSPDFSSLQQMDQADLAIEYAERMCGAIEGDGLRQEGAQPPGL